MRLNDPSEQQTDPSTYMARILILQHCKTNNQKELRRQEALLQNSANSLTIVVIPKHITMLN
jgi:hypothetical protein